MWTELLEMRLYMCTLNQTFLSVLWIVHKLIQLLVCIYAEKIEYWEEIWIPGALLDSFKASTH